jgi:acetoin reductase-like protein
MNVAIVTGAGQGIGRAVARRLSRDGFAVAVVDLDPAGLEETVREIERHGVPALSVRTDLVEIENIVRAVDQVLEAWARLDAFVNNAGRELTKPFLDTLATEWDAMLGINLRSVFFATQIAAKTMVAGGIRGRIVNIASIAGRSGRADQAGYAAAKAGVISVTRSAARALASFGITVNAICPGVVDTAMTRRIHEVRAGMLGIPPAASLQRMIDRIPLGRMANPDDVAGAVAFFCSPQAQYITGQALNVDGGLEMD